MKSVWASKTIWVNIVALVVALAAAFGFDLGLNAEGQASIVAGIMAIVNVVLRLNTSEAVTLRK